MKLDMPTLDTVRAEQRVQWYVLGAASACFLIDYALVTSHVSQRFDDRILLWVHARATTRSDRVFNIITDTGGVGRAVPVVFAAALLLANNRRLKAGTVVVAAVIGQCLTYAVKALVTRDRPNLFYVPNMPTDTSFPSGHALGSTILYGLFAVWLWEGRHRATAGGLVVWIALISFSRVYLGVHHPTDVIASICLGVAFLAGTLLVYDHLEMRALT